jgi:uncharacterized membrane protein YoaK (UPF0700 family)
MFEHNLHQGASRATVLHWFLLAFLAGSVNAGGFLACGRFVSHVTGFATLFGVHVAENRWDAAIGILSVPMYFLLGVMISAYLIDRPFRRGKRPHYTFVMFLVMSCLLAAALLGHYQYFGPFGEPIRLKRDYFLLVLLCGASGLQNGAITTSSGASVRTTHLTGLTTDMGIGLVRALTAPQVSAVSIARTDLEWRWVRFRIGTFLSFAMGSAIGALLFVSVGYLGFLLPAGLAFYAMMIAAISRRSQLSVSVR